MAKQTEKERFPKQKINNWVKTKTYRTTHQNGSRTSWLTKFPKCWPTTCTTIICSGCRTFSTKKSWRCNAMGTISTIRHAWRVWQSVFSSAAIYANITHISRRKSTIISCTNWIKWYWQCKSFIDGTSFEWHFANVTWPTERWWRWWWWVSYYFVCLFSSNFPPITPWQIFRLNFNRNQS